MAKLIPGSRGLRFSLVLLLLFIMTSGAKRSCGGDKGGEDGPKSKEKELIEEALINVRAEPPSRRSMEEVIEVHGNLEPLERVDVVAEVSGTIVDVSAREGDRVRRGDLLARIDDEEYQLNLRQARTALRVARFDYNSTKILYEEGMKSRQEMEQKWRSYEDARTNVDLYELRLNNTKVRSPIDGLVVTRNAEPYREASAMEVLFTVADLSGYEINITVTEAEVAKIRVGQNVRVRVDALAKDLDSFPLEATVTRIQPRVDPQTGTVEVEISLKDPGAGARMGMFARLRIVTDVREKALAIPRRALPAEDDKYVWVVEDGKPRMREIETGLVDQNWVEIVGGLSPEDRVIIEGHTALTENSRINIVAADGGEPKSN